MPRVAPRRASPLRSGLMALPTPKDNTTALVTGSSSGIGAEIARELARRGHGLTLVARREDKLKALADEITDAHGVRTEVIAADLADAASRAELPGVLEQRGLTPDILVNNAGFTTMGPVARAEHSAEVAMVRTNVEAVVDLCTLFVAGMVTRHRGAVLNTASTAAFQPLPGQACYGASKAFVLSYGRALGAELRGKGVTVTTLCPGPVETGFAEAAGMTDAEASEALPEVHVGPRHRRGQGRRRRPGCGPCGRDPGPRQPDGRRAGPPGAEVTDPPADGAAPPVAPAEPRVSSEPVAAMPQLVTELDAPLPRHHRARASRGRRRHCRSAGAALVSPH